MNKRNLMTVRKLLLAGESEMKRLLEDDMQTDIPGSFDLLFEGMRRNPAFGGLISQTGEQLLELSNQSGRTLASVIQVACTHTEFLDSPQIQKVLGKSDFDPAELKTDKNGMSLYLSLPQRFMETHHRWLRMMVSLTLTEMERIKHQPKSGKPVLMVLDEFAGLKRMKVIENAAAQIAGFGVKLMFVTQSLAQLRSIYDKNWEIFPANTGTKIFFGNDDQFTRDYVSKLVGECEVRRKTQSSTLTTGTGESIADSITTSENGGTSISHTDTNSGGTSRNISHSLAFLNVNFSRGQHHSEGTSDTVTKTQNTGRSRGKTITKSENYSEASGENETVHKRPLVTTSEIGREFGSKDAPKAIVLLSGEQPIKVRRSAYFNDGYLAGLYDPHPDHRKPPTLIARELDKHEQVTRNLEHKIEQVDQAHIDLLFQSMEMQEKAKAAERSREATHNKLKQNIGRQIIVHAGLTTAAILTILFVLSVLGYLATALQQGWSRAENLPITDVVAMSEFVVPGIWPFIVIAGSGAILYYGWKLFWYWRDSVAPFEKRVLKL